MTSIDVNGSLHDNLGRYASGRQSAPSFDLSAPAVQVVPPALVSKTDVEVSSYGDYVSEHTRSWLAAHANAGHISAEALYADDPRPHIDALATRAGATFAQRAALYEQAQITMRGGLLGLRDGDQIAAEPLVSSHYGPLCEECDARMGPLPDGRWGHLTPDGTRDVDADGDHDAYDSLHEMALDSAREDMVEVSGVEVAADRDGRLWAQVRTSLANLYDVPGDQVVDFVPDMGHRCHICGDSTVDDPAQDADSVCGTCESDSAR